MFMCEIRLSFSLFPITFHGMIACSSKTNPVVEEYFSIFRWGRIEYIDMQNKNNKKNHRGVSFTTP